MGETIIKQHWTQVWTTLEAIYELSHVIMFTLMFVYLLVLVLITYWIDENTVFAAILYWNTVLFFKKRECFTSLWTKTSSLNRWISKIIKNTNLIIIKFYCDDSIPEHWTFWTELNWVEFYFFSISVFPQCPTTGISNMMSKNIWLSNPRHQTFGL